MRVFWFKDNSLRVYFDCYEVKSFKYVIFYKDTFFSYSRVRDGVLAMVYVFVEQQDGFI